MCNFNLPPGLLHGGALTPRRQKPELWPHSESHANCEAIETPGDVVEADHVGTDSAVHPFRAPIAFVHPHKTSVVLCDDRLRSLDITFWTKVPIASDFAARIISLYLETDHPLLGTFDPGAFVSDLVDHQTKSCSSFVVNALLYWGCVSKSSDCGRPPRPPLTLGLANVHSHRHRSQQVRSRVLQRGRASVGC